ncbi:MAG TPA: ExeM/NucH family extracellular endonuclease [Intrasporangiaceae bacterium]|nr:ExeM/NucH family extracellular endonuclease [Intrasporangiaceae bacterium]
MSLQVSLRRATAALSTAALAVTGLIVAATPAQADVADVVINEFYGRGGSANQPHMHKFVELYNVGAADVDLSGTSIQYRSATGTGNANGVVTLSGTIKAGGYYLVQLNSNGSNGAALPTPDATANVAPSGTTGTIFLASVTTATSPDNAAAVIDKLGYGGSNSPEGTAATYTGGNSTPGSLTRTDFVDTDNNAADFTFTATPTPQNSGATDPDPDPEEPTITPIAEIQGTGASTPLAGQQVRTEGVVTAAYPTGGFRGVYIQTPGTGGIPKAPGDASDGIFVFSDWAAANLAIGDCVTVEGTAGEYNGLTQLSNAFATTQTQACDPVVPTELATLPATDAEKEVYEGMLVHPLGTYTITNNYDLNRFGQIGLAVGDAPLYQATDVVRPGPEALAYEADNRTKYITLDDGSSWDYTRNRTAQFSPLPYLSAQTPMRTASQVTFSQPVILDYRFQWNYQPTGQVVGATSEYVPVASENDRPASAPALAGNLTIGAFNVLNYFDDLGEDEAGCRSYNDIYGNPVGTNYCQVRGAYSTAAFLDQQAKLVTAINKTDADILALMEIENSAGVTYKPGQPRDKALATLVAALNEAAGTTRWAYVPSPTVVPPGEDIIRTAYIYDPGTVQLNGSSQILLDEAFANARYPLAQKFKAKNTGKPFVMIANHFKSKGSGEDDGTGQGLSNPSREAQARALTMWANTEFAKEAVFLVGDFNAYSKETPIQIMEAGGYTNLVKAADPMSATYQFGGRLGSLDHVLANAHAMRLVTGAAVWDINGDESIAFQYSRRNYNIVDFHADDEYASSDHDPVLVGLNTGPRGKKK